MLILSRKLHQSIMIGNDIEITVSAIEGDQVKLAINAPRNIKIHRKEVYLSIQEENKQATNVPNNLLNSLKNMKKD